MNNTHAQPQRVDGCEVLPIARLGNRELDTVNGLDTLSVK